MLLAAGGAAVEVRTQAGNRRVDVLAGELELDVAVERLEARLAARPPARRGRAAGRALASGLVCVIGALPPAMVPGRARGRAGAAAACAGRRARSCTAPRVSCRAARRARRSARRSDARATSTRRWWGVSTSAIARCSVARSSPCSASASGSRPALEIAPQLSGSSGSSRPCQARFRSLTAASSRANL